MAPLTDKQRERAGEPGMLRMAAWWATQYARTSREDLGELRAVAYLALCEASRTFRPGGRVAFPSHAATRIRWALRDAADMRDADEVYPVGDRAEPERPPVWLESLVDRVIGEMTDREKAVVIGREVYGLTLAEVAKEIRVTKERARQVYDRTIHRLRERFADEIRGGAL